MTPSSIILIDISASHQQENLLKKDTRQIPLVIVPELSGIDKYSRDLNTAIIIDTRFTRDKTARYQKIKQVAPQSTVFVFSDYTDLNICRSAIAINGDPKKILPDYIVKYILDSNDQNKQAMIFQPSVQHILGESPAMRSLYNTVSAVAPTNFNIIIYGETGTGKEAIARLIHESSKRKDMPFVTLDCGCLNKETALSELFGHVKGAFTDAAANKTGAFELANGGTLFLDELANLPYDVQVALLRAVQEKQVRKLGAVDSVPCNVRIIAATNAELYNEHFRKDLYYRLNEMSLHLPPLRERGEDILLLATYFLEETCMELRTAKKCFADCAQKKITDYTWPGNVRELKNVVKRSCLLAHEHAVLTADMLQVDDHATVPEPIDAPDGLKDTVQRAEYDQILATLKSVQYNKRKAAALLNIHRKTLYNKLKCMKEAFS